MSLTPKSQRLQDFTWDVLATSQVFEDPLDLLR
jgi:hypothetical protein